nr:unnamed protein product [Callosobruchus chinensis]
MTRKLSDTENLKLVQLYRDNECLWDLKSQNYRNKEMRATALQNIAQEMNLEEFGPTDVKNKIKNLRATYYLELDKIKKSSKSGAGGNVYTPKVKWFEEMDAFIRNVSIQRKTTDNSDTSNNISVPGDHDEINSDAENNSPTPELGLTTSNSNEPTRPRSKRSKLSQMSEMIKDMKNVTQNINMPSEEENDCDIYGKHVASQLKKLSERQFIIAQEEIQKIITKCRLADMENRRLVNIYPNTHFSMRSTTRTPPQQNRYTPSPSPPDVNHSQITASILRSAHEGHRGIVAMKQRLRTKVWWTEIYYDAEKMVRSCNGCTLRVCTKCARAHETKRPSSIYMGRWCYSGDYLVIIVYYLSSNTLRILEDVFSRLGYPASITADNGKQFTSDEFKRFCVERGIILFHSIPYWPQKNGEVERQNRDILKRLKISQATNTKWKK